MPRSKPELRAVQQPRCEAVGLGAAEIPLHQILRAARFHETQLRELDRPSELLPCPMTAGTEQSIEHMREPHLLGAHAHRREALGHQATQWRLRVPSGDQLRRMHAEAEVDEVTV